MAKEVAEAVVIKLCKRYLSPQKPDFCKCMKELELIFRD
jgi:hypothetical protein